MIFFARYVAGVPFFIKSVPHKIPQFENAGICHFTVIEGTHTNEVSLESLDSLFLIGVHIIVIKFMVDEIWAMKDYHVSYYSDTILMGMDVPLSRPVSKSTSGINLARYYN